MVENKVFNEISLLATEKNNPRTKNIDIATTEQILRLINDEDKLVPLAVEKVIPKIAEAVELIVDTFRSGGRLFYIGAGTSGRLGILDAAECPPTFGTDPEMVQGIIAGGKAAVFRAQEGAEDNEESGRCVIDEYKITEKDIIVGIAASGRTPFVKSALRKAKERNIKTILIATIPEEQVKSMDMIADIYICPVVGPEVIAGSTRMKSGTAQKLVLNMLSTASMIKLGKTYNNIMVDLQLTSNKLKERAKKIIMDICNVDYKAASNYLKEADGKVKVALLMILGNLDKENAKNYLEKANGFIKIALDLIKKEDANQKCNQCS
ncbi:MAG: N-acetylmuramic acid 6-phosphate etherase [Ignavibacteria bacterium]|nr:N-acetylmuramic acid 6-phosphate etherase [Ignavibacteria bacterium]